MNKTAEEIKAKISKDVHGIFIPLVHPVDIWEDIPDTYDKPKLCRLEDDSCEACQ